MERCPRPEAKRGDKDRIANRQKGGNASLWIRKERRLCASGVQSVVSMKKLVE